MKDNPKLVLALLLLLMITLLTGCYSEEFYPINFGSSNTSNVTSYWTNQSNTTINTSYNANISNLIICDNGTATIITRNVTIASNFGCTI